MRSLPSPDRTEARTHLSTAIAVYQHKGVQRGYEATPAEIDAVLALYDVYDAALGVGIVALKGPGLAQDLRTAVHDGYEFTQFGRKLATIRTTLLRGLEQCPICGISPPRELDHHLPRSAFHPLAIYVRNLVPLCHECNHSKGAAEPAAPDQRFIHPYLEPLPAIQFLRAVVTLDHGTLLARFEIDPAAALPAITHQRLDYQLRHLKLNERYEREINTYLSGHTVALHDAYRGGGAEYVRSLLQRQAENDFQRFHQNHWRPVLLMALADHAEFCDGGFRAALPLLIPLPVPA